ncbi:peroxidase family protein [Aspergillus saccharolyticus JOP 1030-1]|uniref:Cloroperoxidase n=1 Tax=Aspergillus saccharolyticus JOP 1030-1 TaxID=1450539 RepID=A0A318ZLQ4_9EURO|nr:Cloroperoxidase [Aspergillus saccharolyticus JOP 1030-1]PYH44730.1 Cloroperoxidase [Aspergillus saccharolyticus JOP 1030-1]
MKITLPITLFLGVAIAHPHWGAADISHWKPAGPDDDRGPCPMMNTLANHNFLPHDGRNITRPKLIEALGAALNFTSSLSSVMFDMAIVVNPEPNATYFTLDQLNQHNILEHDASLSRADAYLGNNHIFNATIFEQTRQYWTSSILDATMLANSKLARQITSRATNPTYTFTAKTEEFSLGEVAAPIIVFGNLTAGTVRRDLVKYFFENERLPVELGWRTKSEAVGLEAITAMSNMIRNKTSLLTGSGPVSGSEVSKRDLHFGTRG